jgi:hypothetical protein
MADLCQRLSEQFRLSVVVFTGGEPMLFFDEILDALRRISSFSTVATRVVSNAYWGRDRLKAVSLLRKLKDAGLTELNYSVDDFHQKFIPLSTIANAVNAAREVGLPLVLAHKSYPGSQSSKTTYEKLLGESIPVLEDLKGKKPGESPEICFSTGWTIPVGRGSDKVKKQDWLPPGDAVQSWRGPCNEVLRAINISADGQLTPCCGLVDRGLGVFYAGNVIEQDILEVIDQASNKVIYNWLALEGPSGIKEFVESLDPGLEFGEAFFQNCHLCQELFSNQRVMELIAENINQIGYRLSVSRSFLEAKRQLHFEKVAREVGGHLNN